jgi:aerobic-type carbon monoxide dehydrogenase small subunit (CoxS/CutS family)
LSAPQGLRKISMRINGHPVTADVEPRLTLVDFLRDKLGQTGTHVGCEQGVCGACTILMNGRSVRSCLLFAVQADQAELTTVEGLARKDELHPLQKAFSEGHGLQCGFCTPGFLMTSLELLAENPEPTRDEVRVGLSGNLCRCTGYETIVDAVFAAARALREEDPQP